jgi:tryptophanyl-tRNA synthetase
MALDDPTKKMSKSAATPNNFIALTDDADLITKKVKRAVTDSDGVVRYGEDKPAVSNLLSIFSLLSGDSIRDLEQRYDGKGYGAFKSDLAEVVVQALVPIQQRFVELEADPSIALGALADGADRAREQAARKMAQVRERMGLDLRAISNSGA